MAKITISGMEDKVNNVFGDQTKPSTGGNTNTGTPNTGTPNTGAAGSTTPKGEFYDSGSKTNSNTISTIDILKNWGNGGSSDFGSIYDQIAGSQAGQGIGGTISGIKDTVSNGNLETSINDVKNKYSEMLRQQHDYAAEKLRKERDDALRENWILQQQAEAALPEQLAAAGLNGGATETTLANLLARYQGNRNDILSGYMDNLGDLAVEHAAQQAENERNYNDKWIDYLMQLAQMEKGYEYDKALAALNNK